MLLPMSLPPISGNNKKMGEALIQLVLELNLLKLLI
jgi:hypothetical protein